MKVGFWSGQKWHMLCHSISVPQILRGLSHIMLGCSKWEHTETFLHFIKACSLPGACNSACWPLVGYILTMELHWGPLEDKTLLTSQGHSGCLELSKWESLNTGNSWHSNWLYLMTLSKRELRESFPFHESGQCELNRTLYSRDAWPIVGMLTSTCAD